MLKLLSRALGGLLLVVLAGCCANNPCDCQDSRADALYFSFKITGPNAFSRREITTIYLARYDSTNLVVPRDYLPLQLKQRADSALKGRLWRTFRTDTTGLLIINNAAPFSAATSGGKLSGYFYRVFVPQDSAGTVKKNTFTTFLLDGIRLIGRYQADGCCTCYENSFKRVRVTGGNYPAGTSLNVTEAGRGIDRKPVVIQLSK